MPFFTAYGMIVIYYLGWWLMVGWGVDIVDKVDIVDIVDRVDRVDAGKGSPHADYRHIHLSSKY